jgi:hypothetical protein
MALDFIRSEVADSRLTISGGAGGTRVNSSGNIVSASAPRFDYDPVSLAARGLLVEEQRTNLCIRSQDPTNAVWTKSAVSVPGTTTTVAGLTLYKVVEDSSAANHQIGGGSAAITASGTYTGSIFILAAERTVAQVRLVSGAGTFSGVLAYINLADGSQRHAADITGGAVSGSAVVQNFGNGLYRVQVTGVLAADVTSAAVQVYLQRASDAYNVTNYTGDGSSGVYVNHEQLEAGSFATSYIPTTTAQVTRTADSEVMSVSPWFNASAGTFVVEGDYALISSGNPGLLQVDDGTTNERYMLRIGAGVAQFFVLSGGSTQANITASVTAGTPFKQAGAYAANDFAASVDGGTVGTDVSGSLPVAPTTLRIGQAAIGSAFANGHIRRIRYYPTRLPNAQLQVLTQ